MPSEIVLLFSAFVGTILALAFILAQIVKKKPPRPKNPDDLAKDEAWYRAEQRRISALAEYEMAQAQLNEQRRFFKKQRRA